jgi:hypothetical protein
MGWIKGGRYYQISRYANGKVYLQYYGKNCAFLRKCLAAEMERKAEEEARRRQHRERLELLDRERREARDRAREIDRQAELLLGWLGYRRHVRGQWRRRKRLMVQAIEGPTMSLAAATRRIKQLRNEHRNLIQAIRDDDQADDDQENGQPRETREDRHREERLNEIEREIYDLLQQYPKVLDDLTLGDLPELTKATLAVGLFKEGGADWVATEVRMEQLAVELGGPNPPPELRIAVEACTFAWLDFWVARLKHASEQTKSLRVTPEPVQRQLSYASNRYMRWLKYVAEIKRLSRPRKRLIAVQD